MQQGKLVTVLMPCYNAGYYIKDALDSILGQSYTNIELLLIDDGSTDNSKEIIKEYAAKDSRIIALFNDQNLGLIRTLNKGVALAKGEFIARMDADDISSSERIVTLLAAFTQYPETDVISAGYYYLSESGKVKQRIFPKALNSVALKFVSFFCTPVNHPCVMVKAEVFKNNLFDEQYIHSEDYEIFSRLLLNGYRFMNLQKPLYYLRKNPESVSFKYEKIQISTHTKISARNIELYFNRRFDFFIHKIMINRISFNVSPSMLNKAIRSLEELKKEFLEREKPEAVVVNQVNEFMIEQKIDIYFQSMKYAHFMNRLKILYFVIRDMKIFISGRGIQYIKSKNSFNK